MKTNRTYFEIANDLVVSRLAATGTMFGGESNDVDSAVFGQYMNLVERWGEE